MTNPPGGPPPFQPAYYPPPRQRSSSWLKWLLIGGGIFLGLILLVCGGLVVWGILLGKNIQETQQQIADRIRNDATVERELGPVKKVTPMAPPPGGQQNVMFTYHVQGERASGTVEVTVIFTGINFKVHRMELTTQDDRVFRLDSDTSE